MKLWSAFYGNLSPYLTDCPDFTMEQAVRTAAIQFYQDSRAWRVRNVALGVTVAGQALYTLANNPTDADLTGLPAIWLDGTEVQELRPGAPDDSAPTDTGDDLMIGVEDSTHIRVTPLPVTAGMAMVATAAYCPSEASTGIDDELYKLHWRSINKLALSKLLMQPNKPWTDKQLAARMDVEYTIEATSRAGDAGPRRNPLRVKPSDY